MEHLSTSSPECRRDASRAALIVADSAVRRLRSIGDFGLNFTEALKREYAVIEAAWKESILAEATQCCLQKKHKEKGESGDVNIDEDVQLEASTLANKHISSLSLLKEEDMAEATMDDIEDLHNEVQVCHLEMSGRLARK